MQWYFNLGHVSLSDIYPDTLGYFINTYQYIIYKEIFE